MLILSCTTLAAPCPLADQLWISTSEVATPADFGITTEQVFFVLSWGFGFVLLSFVLGWGLGLALGMIKKL